MREGFTFTELLVALGIFTIIFVMIVLFAFRFVGVAANARAKRTSSIDAAAALEHVLLEVRQGSSLYTPTSDFTSVLGQLGIETSQNLPADEIRTYVDFYVDGGILVKKRDGQIPTPLTSNTTRVVTFDVDDVSLSSEEGVRVFIEIEQRFAPTAARQQRVRMIGTASFRN